ncbi:aKG-HExxH-type peptide beta-hydroxylase [Cryptosporangium aurantiacum]|uniref:HEXXH motif-containing protein n=1 Tax=Cryptosporangium aurantiacum TaxID=134849 RepID=A0A1M7L2B7_9ACTN|nr:HEXXH motif-containing putative peptide modification protein [Cryptosporangium aurantiacum]SHM71955.1 HEXXH motif-containing protein [Cryptosporangium aurantiacum]
MSLPRLRLAETQIDELAFRRPSEATLQLLRAGQASRRRLLLLALWRERAGTNDPAYELFVRAARAAPVAVEEVVDRPLAAASAVRYLRSDRPVGSEEPNHPRALAAAAAIRAGVSFAIDVPAPDGTIFLPTLGTASGLHCATAIVSGDRGTFTVGCRHLTVPASPGPHWRPRQVVALGGVPAWTVEIEDHDPARDCFGYIPAAPLDRAGGEAVRTNLARGWQVLAAHYPDYARAARACLRSVVPLDADPGTAGPDDRAASASSTLAFGCVAITPSVSPETVALLLAHELQHNILAAAQDLTPFTDPPGSELHHAPWRSDPRSADALLQGAYAHAAVTDHWKGRWLRSVAARTPDREAGFHFAYWREVTTTATATLRRSTELSRAGRRLVDGLWSARDSWWAEELPRSLETAAHQVSAADAVHWRIANRRPAPGVPQRLSGAFARGLDCPPLPASEVRAAPPGPNRHTRVAAAIRRRALDRSPPADDARAADGYRRRIAVDPSDDEAWVGLAHVTGQLGRSPAAAALAERPDLVRAVLLAYRADHGVRNAPSPERIAEWLVNGGNSEAADTDDRSGVDQYHR